MAEYGIVAKVKTNNNSLSGQRVDHQGKDVERSLKLYYPSELIDDRVPLVPYQDEDVSPNWFQMSWLLLLIWI